MIGGQAKTIVHNEKSRRFVAPLALTVFIWVFAMNSMDFLPVDLLPMLWQKLVRESSQLPARGPDRRSKRSLDLSSV